MKKKFEALISAGFGVLVLCLGVYALLTGEMKGRNGKTLDPALTRLCGVVFVAIGGFLIVSSGGPKGPE